MNREKMVKIFLTDFDKSVLRVPITYTFKELMNALAQKVWIINNLFRCCPKSIKMLIISSININSIFFAPPSLPPLLGFLSIHFPALYRPS